MITISDTGWQRDRWTARDGRTNGGRFWFLFIFPPTQTRRATRYICHISFKILFFFSKTEEPPVVKNEIFNDVLSVVSFWTLRKANSKDRVREEIHWGLFRIRHRYRISKTGSKADGAVYPRKRTSLGREIVITKSSMNKAYLEGLGKA